MAGLFKPKVAAPVVQPVTPMPDKAQTDIVRRKRLATETKTSGYQSTILSAGGRETLGG